MPHLNISRQWPLPGTPTPDELDALQLAELARPKLDAPHLAALYQVLQRDTHETRSHLPAWDIATIDACLAFVTATADSCWKSRSAPKPDDLDVVVQQYIELATLGLLELRGTYPDGHWCVTQAGAFVLAQHAVAHKRDPHHSDLRVCYALEWYGDELDAYARAYMTRDLTINSGARSGTRGGREQAYDDVRGGVRFYAVVVP